MKRTLALSIAASVALGLGACANDQRRSDVPNPPGINVETSTRDITAGEIVTLTARTNDTYGRDAQVRWTSTAGTLTTEQDGRIARVKFDQPGTYTVKASLMTEGREVQTDMIEIRVKPVG